MLRLNFKTFSIADEAYLLSRQNLINTQINHTRKVNRASSLWENKTSSKTGKKHFTSIKADLLTLCVGVEICSYCENNEATDIEHIYPKKLYPRKTFKSNNYLLACGKCNTHHKKDIFSIFAPSRSNSEIDVTCPRGIYLKPANQDALFINPRIEDPMRLMKLDFIGGTFLYIPIAAFGSRNYKRSKYTIDLLGLNKRAALVEARKSASTYYRNQLQTYTQIQLAIDFPGIIAAYANDFGVVNMAANFVTEKIRVLETIKNEFLKYPQPTVWKEMVRQRRLLPITDSLLNLVPAASTW